MTQFIRSTQQLDKHITRIVWYIQAGTQRYTEL